MIDAIAGTARVAPADRELTPRERQHLTDLLADLSPDQESRLIDLFGEYDEADGAAARDAIAADAAEVICEVGDKLALFEV